MKIKYDKSVSKSDRDKVNKVLTEPENAKFLEDLNSILKYALQDKNGFILYISKKK